MIKKLLAVSIYIMIIIGCKNDKSKTYKEEFYPSGTIKSSGYYLYDSVPFDTLRRYYENGALNSISVYDSNGRLNGSTVVYHKNGAIKQKLSYTHDLLHGLAYDYDTKGMLNEISYYYLDTPVGDYYEFINNNISYYGFYNFQERKLNHIEYDSTSRIVKDLRQVIFIDSIRFYLDSNKIYNCKLLLIISNPPRSSNQIFIKYKLDNGKNSFVDSIKSGYRNSFFTHKKFNDNLFSIEITAKQYDSISRSTKSQRSIINIEYVDPK